MERVLGETSWIEDLRGRTGGDVDGIELIAEVETRIRIGRGGDRAVMNDVPMQIGLDDPVGPHPADVESSADIMDTAHQIWENHTGSVGEDQGITPGLGRPVQNHPSTRSEVCIAVGPPHGPLDPAVLHIDHSVSIRDQHRPVGCQPHGPGAVEVGIVGATIDDDRLESRLFSPDELILVGPASFEGELLSSTHSYMNYHQNLSESHRRTVDNNKSLEF